MPDEGFGNSGQPSADELASRFDDAHQQTQHGGSEGDPNPASGANYHPRIEGGDTEIQDNMAGGDVEMPGEPLV